jgi:hypothetical protein
MNKIEEALTYHELRRIISAFFIPSLGINKLISDEDLKRFLNRIVNRKWGNALRFFATANWEPLWRNRLYFPFKITNKKFDLDQPHQKWLDVLCQRIGWIFERNIFPIVTILDNCSLHDRAKGFWSTNWLNGDANMNGTSSWVPSPYHYYEDEWHDPAHIKQLASKIGLGNNPSAAEIKAWIGRIDETGKRIENFNRMLVEKLHSEFRHQIGYEVVNEGMAGDKWHRIQANLLEEFENPTIAKFRRFTSIYPDKRFDEFYQKGTIKEAFIPSVHSIGTLEDYEKRKAICPVPFIASADGCRPVIPKRELKDLVYRILSDGNLGFESNLRPIFELKNGEWVTVCGKEDWSLNSMKWGWANMVRDGWFKWMES